MTSLSTYVQELVERELVMNTDGYYVWWPVNTNGYLTPAELRAIADIIDEKNAVWDATVKTDSSINSIDP